MNSPPTTPTAHQRSELSGRVAIVTGSSRGIGRAIAKLLAQQGAHVVINGVDEARVEAVSEEIVGDTLAVAGDLTSDALPRSLVRSAMSRWGRLDIVVNNAGYNWDSPFAQMSDEQFQAMLDIHVVAPFRLLRAAAPFLTRPRRRVESGAPFAKVVNISSVSGTMGNPDQANYNAAKAAILGLTKGLAKEWGALGVNVNAVAPGFIETRLTAPDTDGETIHRHGRRIPLGIPEHRRRQGTTLVPLGRLGSPLDVAETVAFLCSQRSNYIHGQVLGVTGGLAIGMEY